MTILPVIACATGIALVVLFEAAHHHIDERWTTPLDRFEWFIVFWVVVISLLVCCHIIPMSRPGILNWVPFGLVVVFHFMMVAGGGSFGRDTPSTGVMRSRSSSRHASTRSNGLGEHDENKPKEDTRRDQ